MSYHVQNRQVHFLVEDDEAMSKRRIETPDRCKILRNGESMEVAASSLHIGDLVTQLIYVDRPLVAAAEGDGVFEFELKAGKL